MGFSALLGNARLRDRLETAFSRGTVSHCWLLAGPEGSGKHTLAVLMAAALQCTADHDRPCGTCSQCRKVFGGIHPDVITVDSEKKTIPVDTIRQASADMSVRPNEGARKVYIIPRAQDMQEPAQNALLKIIEEPPDYGVFLLLTTSQERLLPTIRSRCASLILEPLPQDLLMRELRTRAAGHTEAELAAAARRSGGYLGQALALLENGTEPAPETAAFADAWAGRDSLALLRVLVPLEKADRQKLAALLQAWLELLADALCCQRGGMEPVTEAAGRIAAARTGAELQAAIGHLRQALVWCDANVSAAHICGALAALL